MSEPIKVKEPGPLEGNAARTVGITVAGIVALLKILSVFGVPVTPDQIDVVKENSDELLLLLLLLGPVGIAETIRHFVSSKTTTEIIAANNLKRGQEGIKTPTTAIPDNVVKT